MKTKKDSGNLSCLKNKIDCRSNKPSNFRSRKSPQDRFTWDWIKRHNADPEARALIFLSHSYEIKPHRMAGYSKIREWLHGIEAAPGYYSILVSLERKFFYLQS